MARPPVSRGSSRSRQASPYAGCAPNTRRPTISTLDSTMDTTRAWDGTSEKRRRSSPAGRRPQDRGGRRPAACRTLSQSELTSHDHEPRSDTPLTFVGRSDLDRNHYSHRQARAVPPAFCCGPGALQRRALSICSGSGRSLRPVGVRAGSFATSQSGGLSQRTHSWMIFVADM